MPIRAAIATSTNPISAASQAIARPLVPIGETAMARNDTPRPACTHVVTVRARLAAFCGELSVGKAEHRYVHVRKRGTARVRRQLRSGRRSTRGNALIPPRLHATAPEHYRLFPLHPR